MIFVKRNLSYSILFNYSSFSGTDLLYLPYCTFG